MTERKEHPLTVPEPPAGTVRPSGPHASFGLDPAERLRWAQKMEAMGLLGARVSHEINNLVTLVVGRTSLLLEQADTPPAVRDGLEEVNGVAGRIAELMREWLTLGRRERPAPRALDLNAVLNGFRRMLEVSLGGGIDMVCACSSDPALAYADRGQVEQVLLNLVLNAHDAMNGTGTLTLSTANVTLDEAAARYALPAEPGPYVVLAVRDTGRGMDRATLEHIFDPYFTTKAAGRGTGLGLYTAREILRASGGALQVSSLPGRGSTFSVYFPRAGERAPAPREEKKMPRENVLVLGSDELICGLIRDVLARAGYAVLETDVGSEAVPIHLLVVDSHLPPGGAADVYRLRERCPAMKLLRVGGPFAEDDAPEAGTVLPKPFLPRELTLKVRELLDGPAG